MYKYSDGTIRTAMPFVHNDVQYGVDVFFNWTPEQLAEVGVKEFIEDAIPFGYRGGVPVDVETATQIHRTYPNMIFEFENVKKDYTNRINVKRKSKEEDGFIFDSSNIFIATDVKGSLRMTQMAFVFQADPTHVEEWKGVDATTGEDKWFSMNVSMYQQIVAEGQQYVRDCFLRQQALQEELEALQETPEAYLAFAANIETGWPS